MKKMMLSGSSSIKRLNHFAIKLLDDSISNNNTILVGSNEGVDKLVKQYLDNKEYTNIVCYSKSKYLKMADDCDTAYLLWDGKSRDTLDLYECIRRQNKICLLESY